MQHLFANIQLYFILKSSLFRMERAEKLSTTDKETRARNEEQTINLSRRMLSVQSCCRLVHLIRMSFEIGERYTTDICKATPSLGLAFVCWTCCCADDQAFVLLKLGIRLRIDEQKIDESKGIDLLPKCRLGCDRTGNQTLQQTRSQNCTCEPGRLPAKRGRSP
jgi:hypothetical protein